MGEDEMSKQSKKEKSIEKFVIDKKPLKQPNQAPRIPPRQRNPGNPIRRDKNS